MAWTPLILSGMVAAFVVAAITSRRALHWTVIGLAAVMIGRNIAGLP